MSKKNLILLFIFASAQFFSLNLIPGAVRDSLDLIISIIAIAILIFNPIYTKIHPTVKRNFSIEITILIFAVLFSMYCAQLFHSQNLKTTIIAQRFMYLYFVYYVFHIINIESEDLIKIFIILGVGVFVVYVIQFAIFPFRILDCRVGMSRGTIRIFMPGFQYVIIGYLALLNKYFNTRKISDALLAGVLFMVFFLQGTRQTIAIMGFLTLIAILGSKILTNKLAILFSLFLATIAFFFIFHDVILEMINVTVSQKSSSDDGVRYRAAYYFLHDFFPNKATYFFGNGADSMNSSYGAYVFYLKRRLGFYQSDIGIIGDYTKFGVLYVLSVLLIIIKIFILKVPEYFKFIKLFFLSIVLTSITGRFLFGEPSGIVTIASLLYIIDKNKIPRKIKTSSEILN